MIQHIKSHVGADECISRLRGKDATARTDRLTNLCQDLLPYRFQVLRFKLNLLFLGNLGGRNLFCFAGTLA